jgi:hypothetical protein
MVDALAERLQSARTETPPLPAELWSDPPPNFSL